MADDLNKIKNWDDIPKFSSNSLDSEAAFWLQNQLDGRLMNQSLHKADNRESTTITLRFDPRLLARIKRLARSRFLNYQSMMKQWIAERIEDEIK